MWRHNNIKLKKYGMQMFLCTGLKNSMIFRTSIDTSQVSSLTVYQSILDWNLSNVWSFESLKKQQSLF